jgi:hypothetical protein
MHRLRYLPLQARAARGQCPIFEGECHKFNASVFWSEFNSPKQTHLLVQRVKQRLGVFQVGGVEALGEPAVDRGEHRARFIALTLLCE